MNTPGLVQLVGAGPGDPGLITVRGRDCLRAADVVLYDRLIPFELLAETRDEAVLIDVGKAPGCAPLSQETINERIIEHARRGRNVVRLKGGDPFVFGRGGEELDACRAAGIDCVVVPGVTSAVAVPASAGIPLTRRGTARAFAVITGHVEDEFGAPAHDYEALAHIDTIVILMGHARLRAIAGALIAAGRDPETPAAMIASGTTPRRFVVSATLATLADEADRAELLPPAITVIGETAARAEPNLGIPTSAPTHRPLEGRRVVVTQSTSTSGELNHRLIEAGAGVVHCPLICIHYPESGRDFQQAIERLPHMDCTVFTSIHGVRGFWKGLRSLGRDARALGPCQIAALGRGTARELERYGLMVDLIPESATAESLCRSLCEYDMFPKLSHDPWTHVEGQSSSEPRPAFKVFFPHGNRALPTLAAGLRAAGAEVIESIVYHTEEAHPHPAALANLRTGADAILFCSPSAVERFARLDLDLSDVAIGCIGPTTATAARDLGLTVHVEPVDPGSADLVSVLEDYFRSPKANP
ncbi:MAG: uroporphyrinogen-III C-methyltransferase [Phycisphaerae bacterium]